MVKYVDECEGFVVSPEQSVDIYSKKSAKDKLNPSSPNRDPTESRLCWPRETSQTWCW